MDGEILLVEKDNKKWEWTRCDYTKRQNNNKTIKQKYNVFSFYYSINVYYSISYT